MFAGAAGMLHLVFESFSALFSQLVFFRFRFRETMNQMYLVGVQSLPVIVFSITFISVMLITEFSFHMKLVLRQDSLVPAFATILLVRELGPVLTCLLLTSRVGAGIAAEIGTMKVTEQLDALRLLSLDPVEFLTLPRWMACVFGAAALSVVALAVAIIGAAFLSSLLLRNPVAMYFQSMFLFTRFSDVMQCIIKAGVFGSIIPLVSCYHGFQCRQGSAGVGNASTSAVVQSSVMILVADFVLTYLYYAV
jgi:phospholipid/cholesterol/gamma-HCH transport system permease protein